MLNQSLQKSGATPEAATELLSILLPPAPAIGAKQVFENLFAIAKIRPDAFGISAQKTLGVLENSQLLFQMNEHQEFDGREFLKQKKRKSLATVMTNHMGSHPKWSSLFFPTFEPNFVQPSEVGILAGYRAFQADFYAYTEAIHQKEIQATNFNNQNYWIEVYRLARQLSNLTLIYGFHNYQIVQGDISKFLTHLEDYVDGCDCQKDSVQNISVESGEIFLDDKGNYPPFIDLYNEDAWCDRIDVLINSLYKFFKNSSRRSGTKRVSHLKRKRQFAQGWAHGILSPLVQLDDFEEQGVCISLPDEDFAQIDPDESLDELSAGATELLIEEFDDEDAKDLLLLDTGFTSIEEKRRFDHVRRHNHQLPNHITNLDITILLNGIDDAVLGATTENELRACFQLLWLTLLGRYARKSSLAGSATLVLHDYSIAYLNYLQPSSDYVVIPKNLNDMVFFYLAYPKVHYQHSWEFSSDTPWDVKSHIKLSLEDGAGQLFRNLNQKWRALGTGTDSNEHLTLNSQWMEFAIEKDGVTSRVFQKILESRWLSDPDFTLNAVAYQVHHDWLKRCNGEDWVAALMSLQVNHLSKTQFHYNTLKISDLQNLWDDRVADLNIHSTTGNNSDLKTTPIEHKAVVHPVRPLGVGNPLLPKTMIIEQWLTNSHNELCNEMLNLVKNKLKETPNLQQWVDAALRIHNLLAFVLIQEFMLVTGYRPRNKVMILRGAINEQGWIQIQDKDRHKDYSSRLVYVPPKLVSALEKFEQWSLLLQRLIVCKNQNIDPDTLNEFSEKRPFIWIKRGINSYQSVKFGQSIFDHGLMKDSNYPFISGNKVKLNMTRHWLRSMLFNLYSKQKNVLHAKQINAYLGHYHRGCEPFDTLSSFSLDNFQNILQNKIDYIYTLLSPKDKNIPWMKNISQLIQQLDAYVHSCK